MSGCVLYFCFTLLLLGLFSFCFVLLLFSLHCFVFVFVFFLLCFDLLYFACVLLFPLCFCFVFYFCFPFCIYSVGDRSSYSMSNYMRERCKEPGFQSRVTPWLLPKKSANAKKKAVAFTSPVASGACFTFGLLCFSFDYFLFVLFLMFYLALI